MDVVWGLLSSGRSVGEGIHDVFFLVRKVSVECVLFVERRRSGMWVARERVRRVPNDRTKGERDERRDVVGGEEWLGCMLYRQC